MKKILFIIPLLLVLTLAGCGSDETNLEAAATKYLDELLIKLESEVAPINSVEKFEWVCTEIDANNANFTDCTYLIEYNNEHFIVGYMLNEGEDYFVEVQQPSLEEYEIHYEEIYQAVAYLELNPEEAEANYTTFEYGEFSEQAILDRVN